MRYVRFLGGMCLALAFGLSLLIVTADDAEVTSFDPYHPATLLPLVASRLHAVHAYVRGFRVSDFLAAATAGFRARIRREGPIASEPQ